MRNKYPAFIVLVSLMIAAVGCKNDADPSATGPASSIAATPGSGASSSPAAKPSPSAASASGKPVGGSASPAKSPAASSGKSGAEQAMTNPDSVAVLVNKQYGLPESYDPNDLVYPDIPFTFKEKLDKRKMRKEAAGALEQLAAGAEKNGISLAGVSAYRSYATQKTLFNNYVKQDGEEKAKTYSAEPGHSEHETGLAIDVSGADGKCAAQDCFGGTKEAKWLAEHAQDYGFIIRYPKGKESVTGYQYEPWHIRYVGTKLAKELADKGLTLEEYYKATPVTKQ